jgi:hypothetical protein
LHYNQATDPRLETGVIYIVPFFAEVATEEPNETAIIRAAKELVADVVFVTLDNLETRPRMCTMLFRSLPSAQILAIGRKSLVLFWFEQGVQSVRLEYSLDAILQLFQGKPCGEAENQDSRTHDKQSATPRVSTN